MDTEHICPSCRKPLPPNAPKGLCPECLMKAGFGTGSAPEPGQPSKVPHFVPPSVEEVAKLFPQFEMLELLGQGGMGAVYKARQPSLDRLVALKILPPETGSDAGFADRFTREARALARLSHPNIVGVHEFGQAGGLHYFAMEYVEGLNLRQLEQAGKLAPREALKIIPQICDALQFAHDEGIVHRDIKPENVMLDKKGRVKITDFGLAKILGREPEALRLTGLKDVMGTPHYMAPEQVEKPQEVDHRADIYSLGVVFYEMLTGELPLGKFQAPSKKVQVDVRLDEVVLHALEKEPERRYQQASQVKTDVETIAATTERPGAPPVMAPSDMNPWQPAILLVGVVMGLALLIAGTVLPRGVNWMAFLFGSFALVVSLLKLAGLWPFPSGLFPQSNFTGRNLPGRRRTEPSPTAEPHFSRAAMWGAVWAPLSLFFIAVVLFFTPWQFVLAHGGLPPALSWSQLLHGGALPGPTWLQALLSFTLLPLGLMAPFGTTILGGIAISQIRHSRGRLYGLGLAVFDVLLFPLLGVNGLLIAGWNWLAYLLTQGWLPQLGRPWFVAPFVLLIVTSCLAATGLIIRAVWRAANKAPGGGETGSSRVSASAAPAPRAGSAWRVIGIVAVAVLVLAVLMVMLSLALYHASEWKRQQVTGYDPDRVGAVEQKLTRETADHLRAANYQFNHLFVNVRDARYKDAQCEIKGLRKPVSQGLHNVSLEQLSNTVSGGLSFRHTGNGLWGVHGTGDLTNVNFTVDASAEMGPRQEFVVAAPEPSEYPPDPSQYRPTKPYFYPEPEEGGAAARPAAVLVPRFGPVREVTLNDIDEHRGSDALDLDSGQLLSVPKDIERRSEPMRLQWLADRGVDLMADKASRRWRLGTATANELKLTRLENERWDAIAEESLSNVLAAGPKNLEVQEVPSALVYVLPADAQPPLTFAFRTASGAEGVLQITGFTERPRSARLRYKLVQPDSVGTSSPDTATDFVAQHRAELGQKALDAARDFVEEHQWKMQSEWGNNQGRVVFKAADGAGKHITFEELFLGNGMARFTISTDLGAELSARRIGAAIWRRLGWRNPYPAPLDQQTTSIAFGPEKEVVLTEFNNMDGQEAFDLDSGKVHKQPKDMDQWSEAGLTQWVTQNVIDLLVDEGPGHRWGLMTTLPAELRLGRVTNEKWSNIDLEELLAALTNSPLPLEVMQKGNLKVVILPKETETPATFAFKTSAGGLGLLQVAAFTDKPRGVRIRYKMVIPPTTETSAASQAGPRPFAAARPGEFKVTLTNGVDFEVVAIASSPRSSEVWWQPDGALLAQPPGDKLGGFSKPCGDLRCGAEFAVLGTLTEGEAVLEFEPRPQQAGSVELYKAGQPKGQVSLVGFRTAPESLTCRIGLPNGQWERMATWDQAGTLLNNQTEGELRLLRSGSDGETCLRLALKADLNRYAVRLTARLNNGAYKNARTCVVYYGSQHNIQLCALIQGLQDSDVVAYELYRMPLRWAVVPGIATRPNVPPIQGQPSVSGPAGNASRLEDLPEVDRARAVALFNDIEDCGRDFEETFSAESFSAARAHAFRLLLLLTNFNAVVRGTDCEFPAALVSDVAKLRQAMYESDYGKARQAGRYKEQYAGEFRRIGNRVAELARRLKPGVSTSFGPVIEWQLTGDWVRLKKQQVLDLDEDRLLSVPTSILVESLNNPRPLLSWMVSNRADLQVSGDRPSDTLNFHLDDGLLVRVEAQVTFDGIEPREIGRYLAKPGASQHVSIPKAEVSALPVCVFQTREGGRGVLQVIGYTDRPYSAKIRYKLVQTPANASRLQALSEPDRARAVALFNDIEDFGHEFNAAFTAKNLPAAWTGSRRLLNLLSNFNAVVKGTGYEFPAGIFDDIGKVREALREGDWEKARRLGQHNEEYAREFKRIAARMVELARKQQAGAGSAFGMVVERVISGEGDANKRFIDLDKGRLFAAADYFGPKAEPSPAETQKWLRETGIDAVADTRAHYGGLVGFNMVASPVPNEEWDRLAPSRLDYYLTMSAPGTPVVMSGKGELPATYAVSTREGGKGLLQIVSMSTNKPPEVKIRYKLVQPSRP